MPRDGMGILCGDLDYGAQWPVTVLSHITPIVFPCQKCTALVFHVVGEQHAGLGIKIPFMRKPLATIGKGYQLICNNCTTIATQLPRHLVVMLENHIIPSDICGVYSCLESAPEPYTKGFVEHYLSFLDTLADEARGYVRTILAIYRRKDVPP